MKILPHSLERMLAVLPLGMRTEAAQRFENQAPLLLDRLSRLYGTRADFAEWFAALMESVARAYAARSTELRVQDAARLEAPHWFLDQQMLGYSAYVDRFAGTLRGVGQRIPHLRELGVSYLHLLPFLRPRAGDNDGGFAVASYDDVDPRLGTISDLEALTAQLRKAGISLCSDFILNHVADDHAWALGAAKGDVRLQDYFYAFPDRSGPDNYERTVAQVFPQAAPGNFTYSEPMQRWVWTTFYPYQWDLNYTNPAVFAEMTAALLRLANRGIEVFRLDSTAFLWKREGTDCMNQPEAHWILQAIRCIVEIAAPGVLLKAEAIVPTRELPAYLGADDARGRECHLAYHSSLMAAAWVAIAEQRTDILRKVVEATPELPTHASWLTYVRCHDDIGWKVLRPEVEDSGGFADSRLAGVSRFFEGEAGDSFASGTAFQTDDDMAAHGTNGMAAALLGYARAQSPADFENAERRLSLLYGLAFCFGGLPVIFMGDEFALGNDESAEGASSRALDSRWLQRPALDESRYAQRHDTQTEAGSAFAAIRFLVGVRRRQQAFAADEPRRLLTIDNAAILAIKRGEKFITLLNFSSIPQTVDLEDTTGDASQADWLDWISETNVTHKIQLEPWSMAWLERKS